MANDVNDEAAAQRGCVVEVGGYQFATRVFADGSVSMEISADGGDSVAIEGIDTEDLDQLVRHIDVLLD